MLWRLACAIAVFAAITACSGSVKVTIDPAAATVVRNGTLQFQAVVTGSNTGVTWRVLEGEDGGSIDASGKYTAPSSAGLFHVVAVSKANSAAQATAAVTVTADAVILQSVTPSSPANENAPLVEGTTAPGAHVILFATEDCSGADVGSGNADDAGHFAVRIEVPDDSTTVLRATATSQRITSACSTSSLAYVEDSTPPVTPALVSVTPESPSNNLDPVIDGTAEPASMVQLYFEAGCEGPLRATVKTGETGAFQAAVRVLANATTTVSAKAADLAGNVSACSSTISYTHAGEGPTIAEPTFTQVLPAAVASDHAPRFVGTAETGTIVTLFSDAACTTPVATGSAAQFSSTGITVTVGDGESITVHANASDGLGHTSTCSSSSLSYRQEDGTQPAGWRGPEARLEFVSGTNEVFITIAGQRHRPVFLSVNPQGITDPITGWPKLLAQIDLASQQGMPIIDLMLGNKSVAWLQELSQQLGNRQVFLWLRFDMWIPELASVGAPELQSLAGVTQTGYRKSYALGAGGWSEIPFYTSMDQRWLNVEQAALTTLLNDVSQSGIGDRVIGVRTTYMAGGEWFQPPLAFHDNTVDEDPPNQWPWSHPGAFSVGDYAAAEQTEFSQWLASIGLSSALPFPTPADRINPKLGRTFLVNGTGAGVSAVLYHRFLSARVARYQSELAHTAKTVTQSKALTMVNNGYLFSLAYYNGSLHTAFADVLNSPYIDAISAPYNYNTLGSRSNGFAFIPHGPMDSPALHGKLWVHEDDSRPYWTSGGWRTTNNAAEDQALLLRNAVTSLVHGNALYFFDLPNEGWFGGHPQHASETQSLYGAINTLKSKLADQLKTSGAVKPQIAVFVDDQSYHLYPEFGFDGADSYGTSNALLLGMVEKVSRVGAPVRYYLLDDLGNPDLDVSSFKAVFFLNTPRLTQAQRQQIQSRLMNNGRVLYFQHVSGLFDESMNPSWVLAADYAPGMTSLADIEGSASTGVTFADHGGYVIAYSPRGADAAAVDSIMSRAGLHRYTNSGVVVDGAGTVLMVHANGGSIPVQLTSAARVVDMLTGTDLCTNCSSLTLNLSGPQTRVLHLQPAVPTGQKRLFRYEFTPGVVGGSITTDEVTYCSIPDGNVLAACGFTVQDYVNAPINAVRVPVADVQRWMCLPVVEVTSIVRITSHPSILGEAVW